MRGSALAVCLAVAAGAAACTIGGKGPPSVAAPVQPTEEMMPSEVLDRQDPGADTSRNPELSRSSSGSLLGGLFGGLFGGPSSSLMVGPAEPPHYYKGCGGCASDRGSAGAGGALVLAHGLSLSLSRRRRRSSRRS